MSVTNFSLNCRSTRMEPEPKKRRSFVDFRRKSLLFDKMFTEDNNVSSCSENSNLTMEKYVSSLKEERIQWKDILNLRHKQLERIKNSCSFETMNITANDVDAYLTEEDKDFLNQEPDYASMMECVNKYLQAVDFFKRYKSDLIEYYNEIVEEIKTETDLLVDYLCQSEMCELCNQVNCNESTHKFPNS